MCTVSSTCTIGVGSRARAGRRIRIDESVAGILTEGKLPFYDDDALVGIVEVRSNHMAGGESYQQVHSAGAPVGVQHDPSGSIGRVLLMGPIGGIEVDHYPLRTRLPAAMARIPRNNSACVIFISLRYTEARRAVLDECDMPKRW